MLPLAAIGIGAGASLGSGLLGYFANKSAAERAQMLQNENLQRWLSINIPNPKDQELALEKFVVQGTLTPQLETAIANDPTEFQKIVTSPSLAAAQNRALGELSRIGYEGGLRLEDKAALMDARMDAINREKSNRQGIVDQMARMGASGSGFDMAARLQGQSDSADREAMAGLKIASDAQNRALEAIKGAGGLATQYRTQDFGEQAQRASAADKINMFNTENLRGVQQRNIGAQNRAQEMNLAQKQKTADENVKQANYQQEYNKGLDQKRFENEMRRMQGASGATQALAQGEINKGQNLANLYGNIGSGISSAAASYPTYAMWDEYFKNKDKK